MEIYQSIAQAILAHSANHPERAALIDQNQQMSYAQLGRCIQGCGEWLAKECALLPGERVVLIAEQTVPYAAATFAVQLAGGVIVPLEKNCAKSRVEEIVKAVGARLIVANTDDEYRVPFVSLNRWIHEGAEVDSNYGGAEVKSDDLSKIMFTTGTTGKSKGVMITNSVQTAVAQNLIDALHYQADDVSVIPLPLNHGYGNKRLYTAMYAGVTAVLSNGVLFAKQFVDLVCLSHGTMMHIVPAHFQLLSSFAEKDLTLLASQIRLLEFGATALPGSVMKMAFAKLPNTKLYLSYGCTEAAAVSMAQLQPSEPTNFLGTAMKNSKIFTVDKNGNSYYATKENPGRIVDGGKTVMAGYWDEPELTAKVLRNGHVYTSDLGYYDEWGRLCFLGRMGDVINAGGIKISPAEIEDVALKHPLVEECACVSAEDPVLGNIPVLYVVAKNEEFFVRELFDFMRENSEPRLVPKKILTIEKLPRTGNGKIDRKKLRGMYP